MKKLYALMFACATLLCAMCSNDKPAIAPVARPETHSLRVIGAMPELDDEEDTRASGESVIRLKWAAGDRLSLINLTTGKALAGDLVAQSSGAVTSFGGDISGTINDGDKLALIYPSQHYIEEQTYSPVTIDVSEQTGSSSVPICAYSTLTYTSGGEMTYESKFQFLTAYVRLNLATITPATAVQKVVVTHVPKSMTLNLTADGISPVSTDDQIVMTPSESASNKGTVTLFFTTPASTGVSSRKIYIQQNDAWTKCDWTTKNLLATKLYNSIAVDFTSTATPPVVDPATTLPTAITEADLPDYMVTKGEAYRTEVEGLQNGVYIYSATVTAYASAPEKLAARLKVLGFTDAYLSMSKTQFVSTNTWLRTFIARCTYYGVKVHAMRITESQFLISDASIIPEVELIRKYNRAVCAAERFVGIAADLEPHMVKSAALDESIPYVWNGNNYASEGNSQLLRVAIERMTYTAGLVHPDMTLNEAYFYNYQIYFNSGALTYGSVPEFLGVGCDRLVVMAYRTTKESIWEKSLPCLAATTVPQSVSIAIKTATNDAASSSINSKGWNYLIGTLNYLRTQAASQPSFRGIDMFTWESVESMWGWTSDTE